MSNPSSPNTYYLSYECGFVCQTTFELTPAQYLELIISVVPCLNSPLKTKIPVERLVFENGKLSCVFDSKKILEFDTTPYTLKETTWGGGAFNNCLNEAAIGEALKKCGYTVTPSTAEFPLISSKELFSKIETLYKTRYPSLKFLHKNGTPRQAVILMCNSIETYLSDGIATKEPIITKKIATLKDFGVDTSSPKAIQETLPKTINFHDRIAIETAHKLYCPEDPNGFYPINNHLPEETFDCLERLEKTAEIEFRIGSTQIQRLCQKELPEFKLNYGEKTPADSPIKRSHYPILWLLQNAKRVCLNLAEAQQIVEHENGYKFLPRLLKKEDLITNFVSTFGIQNAVVSDGENPLTLATNHKATQTLTLTQHTLNPDTLAHIKNIYIKNNIPMTENETGCGDTLVIGLEFARRLQEQFFPEKEESFIAQLGLTLAVAKFFWKESNFGNIPNAVLENILSVVLEKNTH